MVDSSGFSRSNFSELKPFSCSRRFETEYETLSKLGRGGFSSVYMVRNLLDNSLSAVKKIVIKINHQNKYNIQSEVKNALQEIRTLANIKSEYVVVYKHSWIEVKIKVKEPVKNRMMKRFKSIKSMKFQSIMMMKVALNCHTKLIKPMMM